MKRIVVLSIVTFTFLAVSVSAQQNKVVVIPLNSGGPTKCASHPQWQPVDCTTTQWVWSSHRSLATTLEDANLHRVLWAGDQHSGIANTCSLDGSGWVSTAEVIMSGCDTEWSHIGGSFTGDCSGHDGDIVRRLVLGSYDCYDY
jgi:hypothetical protein